MITQKVARISEMNELEPRIVSVKGTSIAIYKFRNKFFAYLNQCPHQGGPTSEGLMKRNIVCELGTSGKRIREYESTDHYNILCPWHGLDYDLETGVCKSNKRYRLKSYRVWTEGEDLFVEV